jgi:hypothetical protein
MSADTSMLPYWRVAGDCAFWLVLIGVGGEALVTAFAGHLRKYCGRHITRILEISCGALVVLGLVFENNAHHNETSILDSDNAVLHQRASDAEAKTEELRKTNDALEMEIAAATPRNQPVKTATALVHFFI